MSIFSEDKNKGAYQGELTCPFVIDGVDCCSKAIRFVEQIAPNRDRYRCRKCGNTFQYDTSNRPIDANPYAPYRKGKIWSKLEKSYDEIMRRYGMTPVGGGLKGGVQ